MIKYSRDHEWIRVDGDQGVVGISDYAQESLGDIVFVELPEVGASFSSNDEVAVVESVKAASEIYTPVGGEITAVNEDLAEDPSLVNSSPMEGGWFYKIKISYPSELGGLMDEAGEMVSRGKFRRRRLELLADGHRGIPVLAVDQDLELAFERLGVTRRALEDLVELPQSLIQFAARGVIIGEFEPQDCSGRRDV